MLEQTTQEESKLVLMAQRGDRAAYGELVSRHYEAVIRVVYRLCGDEQLAQDAAQDAFIKAWVRLADFQPRAPFRSWVYRIAVNTALDSLRQKPQRSIEDDEEGFGLVENTPGPEAAYLQKEQQDFLQKAVRALPEAARSVLVLREYGEQSYEEIAATLEIPIGTVMSRLNYARTRLREVLRSYRFETEVIYARSHQQ